MDERTLVLLEFDAVLHDVERYAVSAPSKEAVVGLVPLDNERDIADALRQTEEAYTIRHKYLVNPVAVFDDCIPYIEKALVGGVLTPGELMKIAGLIRSSRIAKSAVSGCGDDIELLKSVVGCIFIATDLEKEIGACVAGENELRDDASAELKAIRRKIASANIRLKEKLVGYSHSPRTAKFLQDSPVTVRDGRFVIPLKSEYRSEIPGIIHDVSGSGATVFVEPFPVVELNNEIRTLKAQEQSEIERILRRLSDFVALNAETLKIAQKQCTMLDVICAKSEYSVANNCIKPAINSERYVDLISARHPLIDKNKVVPVGISVGRDFSVLVITGPNTGGKTVCLKTLGLLCLMAYSGIFIPCAPGSSVCVFDNIFCDIGDEQSIEQSLSTFSSHIVNLVDITDRFTAQSLLLLDELGAGTDPAEGAALAIGILKYIECTKARAVITTHYGELKEYSLLTPNLTNASMEFDEATLRPTYRLIMGLPGVSNALKICAGLGLNDFILREARAQLREEKVQFEKILAEAQSAKTEAEKQLEEARELKLQLEKEKAETDEKNRAVTSKLDEISANAKIKTAKIVSDAEEEADRILAQIKAAMDKADSAAYLEAKRKRKKLEDMRYAAQSSAGHDYRTLDPSEIRPGKRVIVKSLEAEGTVQSFADRRGEVTVVVGVMPVRVAPSDLAEVYSHNVEAHGNSAHIFAPATSQSTEIKVLGMTVSEAVEVIEPFIAANPGAVLRIIHGKGTGALGKGIQNYLKLNPRVKSYRYGHYGEGETGVTVAELK